LGVLCVDTETDSLSPTSANLVGISLAVAPNEAGYAPLGHRSGGGGDLFSESGKPTLGQLPLADVIAALKPVLEDSAVLKVGQNIKFDLSVFAQHGVAVAPIDDTMLISYVLAAGLHSHGMDDLSERHLGHRPISFSDVTGKGKAQVTFDCVPIEAAARYAAEDADVTLRLWRKLKPSLGRDHLLTVYETLERPMPSVLAAMERTA
jgi:DNA polymerase-1